MTLNRQRLSLCISTFQGAQDDKYVLCETFEHWRGIANRPSFQLLYIVPFLQSCGHILPAMSSADSFRTKPFYSDVHIDQSISYIEITMSYHYCGRPQGGPFLGSLRNLLDRSETQILIPALAEWWNCP
jgi:hypothetical protein